jgi:hypothetical protein
MKAFLSWASIAVGLVAAGLWLYASNTQVDYPPGDAALEAMRTASGFGRMNLAETWKWTSKLNAWAAGATGLSVLLQTLANMIHDA